MTSLTRFSIDQFANAWRLMCDGCEGRASATLDGVELLFSGLPIPFFNIGFATGRDTSADALAAAAGEACAWAGARGVPWMFVTTHEEIAPGVDANAVLDAAGLAPAMPLTGMLASSVAPGRAVPDGLTLTRPDDDAACAAITTINARAYAMDLNAANAMLGRRDFWRGLFPVVAHASGSPVACAAVMMVDGHRYVALVATEPEQQRRGFADAAMRRALADAAAVHGEAPTVLHATDAGKPVYERMGYQAISHHTVYMEKRFLSEH